MPTAREWFVADFETTSERYYQLHGYTRVWLYAIADSNGNAITHGSSIEQFFSYCRNNLCGKIIYFHNLKFDGAFLLDYLFSIGYKADYKDKPPKTFSTLIGDMGEFYTIDVRVSAKRTLHFADSLKLLPFKVSYIATSFGLPILKEKIDYDDYTIDASRISYVEHDVRIVAMALAEIKAHGMAKSTTASCAYNAYTGSCDDRFLSYCFPTLDIDFLTEWRKAYRGGRCQVSPLYQGRILTNVLRYDVNSMYPHVMRNCALPYGLPVHCSSLSSLQRLKFGLMHVRIEFMLKKYHMPTLLKKGGLYSSGDSYYINSEGEEELWLSSIDYELLLRHYDILSFVYLDGYGFYTSTKMFTAYIDKWYSRKKVDKLGKKQVDKFMLNCLYGKFGTDVMKRQKVVYYEEEKVKFKYTDYEESTHYYLPVAIAVTSYAHKIIDDAIESVGYENFVYCDTDSVHALAEMSDSMVDATELGKFKLEGNEEMSKYVRQKCYLTYEGKKMKITCAGMSEEMKDSVIKEYGLKLFDEFDVGFKCGGKKLPQRVKGGVVLHETTFEIK